MRSKYKDLLKNDFDFAIKSEEGNLFEGINMIPYRLLFVCRDHKWEKLPHVLLVKGDYVYTHQRYKDLEENEIDFELTAERGFYILKETWLAKTIERSDHVITHYDQRKEVFYAKIQFYLNAYAIMATVVFVLTLILNIIRVSVPVGRYDWVYLMLMQPVYVIICMLPVGFSTMWLAEYTFTSARISTLFHELTTHRVGITDENKHRPIPIPIGKFLQTIYRMIVGKTTLYWEHLLSLGSLTSLCCVDKNGLLADLLYAPEKLLFIKTKESDAQDENHILPSSVVDEYQQHDLQAREQQELFEKEMDDKEIELEEVKPKKRSVSLKDEVTHHVYDQSETVSQNTTQQDVTMTPLHVRTQVPDYVTLDITFDRNADDESNVLTFEEPDWKDHINTLRPLGLNALITGCSPLPDFDTVQGMLDAKSHLWKKYMYLLGKEIGFSDSVLDSFAFRKRIHTQFKNLEMSAVIVDYEGSGMQIQSFGHPDLLIEYCSDYWDGTDIKPITSEVKNYILETFNQWGERRDLYCLALAYKPVDSKYAEMIVKDKSNIINIDLKEEEMTISESVMEISKLPHSPLPSMDEMMRREELEKTERKRAKLFNRTQRGQIFLGMAAFRQQPKRDLEKFIEHLTDAGIRFVFYSKGSAQKTKAFGSKIGLVTDWNCCISLAEREDLKMDESDLKAQLPHGIDNIRKHLKEVDDVPLLVSLFSDSQPESTMNMISILQENDEVVCVVGGSIGVRNTPIFVQGNVAISVDPSSEHQRDSTIAAIINKPLKTVGKEAEDVTEPLISGEESVIKPKNDFEEDFADIFSFPCAFHIKSQEESFFPVVFHLIKESRRMTNNMKQSFLFYMGATFTVFVVQILTQFILLPTPMLDGIQALWMVLVIIPLLSFSLLLSPMEPNIMNLISSKGLQKWRKYVSTVALVILRFFLAVPVSMVAYVWTFFCMERSNVFVYWSIFGGQVQESAYRSPEFQATIVYASNIAQFVLVLYFIFTSVGFNHRVHSIFIVKPFFNLLWLATIVGVILLQAAYCAISMAVVGSSLQQVWPDYPFYAYIIVFVLPFIIIVFDELIKIKLRKTFKKNQQRLQLQFGTRLGMYSPK